MTGPGAPLRFLALLLALWIGGRGLWLWNAAVPSDPVPVATGNIPSPVAPYSVDAPPSFESPRSTTRIASAGGTHLHRPAMQPINLLPSGVAWLAAPDAAPPPSANHPGAAPSDHTESRWSGSAWLFARGGKGADLASNGQIGGSQAGARIRWRINETAPVATALTARVSSPIDDPAGTDAAIGVEWHPIPARPFWLAVERRVALGDHARNAWTAYAAGGVWKPDLPGKMVLEGYGQAGVVGARSRDLFADGAVRLSKPLTEDSGGIRAGIGLWGAAQPGASRLDFGPQAIVPVKLGEHRISISADLRVRVAGDAAPGTGLALTIGTDF